VTDYNGTNYFATAATPYELPDYDGYVATFEFIEPIHYRFIKQMRRQFFNAIYEDNRFKDKAWDLYSYMRASIHGAIDAVAGEDEATAIDAFTQVERLVERSSKFGY